MKHLLALLLSPILLTLGAHAAGGDLADPLRSSYNQAGASFVYGDYGYSAARLDASVALGKVPYLFATATVGGSDDFGSNDYYGIGIGFRIRTSTETSLDLDLGYALQRYESGWNNNMVALGAGFRAKLGEKAVLVARARYFISNITVTNNAVYADDFTELSVGPSFYVNDRLSIDAHVSKLLGQYDDLRFGLGASFHF
jgi:hypothetical protein